MKASGNLSKNYPGRGKYEDDVLERFKTHCNSKSNPHGVTASQVGAYSREETEKLIEEKLDGVSSDSCFYEEIKLNEVTTVEGDGTVGEYSLSSTGKATFNIDVTGEVKISCYYISKNTFENGLIRFGTAALYVDGVFVQTISMLESPDYIEVNATKGISIVCEDATVVFNVLEKRKYVKDAITELENSIGDIDAVFDELHNYAQALISGGKV